MNAGSERRGHQEAHVSMEEKLYNECIAMRHQGKPVKRWWFVRIGKHILGELKPDHNFLFSNHWFERFQNRYNISLRRETHCSQKPPTALAPETKKFHSSLLRLRNTGNFKASGLANMGQMMVSVMVMMMVYHLCLMMVKLMIKKV